MRAYEPLSLRIDELSDILEHAHSTLIIDTRPFLSFRQSHVTGSLNLYVPPLLLRRLRKTGCCNVEKLTNCQDVKAKLNKRHDVPVIVYTDTTSPHTSPHNLRTIVDTLLGDCHKLYVLEDPYEDFAAYYPHLISKESSIKNETDAWIGSTGVRSRSPREAAFLGASKPAEIIPFLYLGNEQDSSNLSMLRKLGVSKVLNVSRDCANHFPEFFEYLNLPVEDRVYADISQHFGRALQFIEHARGEGCSVLVHCRAGISRSATVIMAYLIQYYNKSMEEAFDFIKLKHPCISPNFNFMGQLLQFQNLHHSATKQSSGSTPSWTPDDEDEEEESSNHLDSEEYPVLELQPVPLKLELQPVPLPKNLPKNLELKPVPRKLELPAGPVKLDLEAGPLLPQLDLQLAPLSGGKLELQLSPLSGGVLELQPVPRTPRTTCSFFE